jgi:hypothetical protein
MVISITRPQVKVITLVFIGSRNSRFLTGRIRPEEAGLVENDPSLFTKVITRLED